MKKIFLMIVVPALLVAMGFAQTPTASSNTDQINIKGCLGGSDGNYTVAEDNTGKIFKITSSADLKAYVGQDVNFIGHKAGTAENSVAVTEFNMISEHCATAAAAPAASVSAPTETAGTPSAATAALAASAPVASISAVPETISVAPAATAAPAASAPVASISKVPETISTPSETVSTLPAAAAAPAAAPDATVSTPVETASAPAAAAAVHRTRPPARPPEPAVTPAATPAPAEPVSPPTAVAPATPVEPPSEAASTPAASATQPTTSRSIWMLVSIVVLVILLGALVPLYSWWRRRKLLEQTSGQNLSFSNKASSDPGKSDEPGGRKAA
jgi:hypothetical protein